MKARPRLKIKPAWFKLAPQHRRSLASNPNWWVCVARLVKQGVKVEAAIERVEDITKKGEDSDGCTRARKNPA